MGLGINFLVLDKGLGSLSPFSHSLDMVVSHLVQAICTLLTGKAHVPQNLGFTLFKGLDLFIRVLDEILGCACTITMDPETFRTGTRGNSFLLQIRVFI